MALLRKNGQGVCQEVRDLQELLNKVGARDDAGDKLVVDGDFGPKTEQSVLSFQARENLDDDGVVGPITWAALRKAATGESVVTDTPTTLRPLTVARLYHQYKVREKPAGGNRGGPDDGVPEWACVDRIISPWFKPSSEPQWCAMFVSQCVARAKLGLSATDAQIRAMQDADLPHWPPTCSSWKDWANARGKLRSAASYTPKPGDAFLCGTGHIGFVESVSGGSIVTCEGNCSQKVASISRPKSGKITHYIVL